MGSVTRDSGPRARVGAVEKAADLLAAFSPLTPQLTVRQLAERTGLPRSTTHALCASLVRGGLLERVDGGGHRLGPSLVGLGGQVIERTGLVAAAEGIIQRLPDRPGLEAHLGQLVGGWIVYLDRAARPPLPRMENRVGLRAPAHRSGCGKAALSRLPPGELDEVLAGLETRGERTALDDELAAARNRGYVVNRGFQPGRTSIAAPLMDVDGHPLGGLSMAGPSEAFTATAAEQAIARVVDAAEQVSHRLAAGASPTVSGQARRATSPRSSGR